MNNSVVSSLGRPQERGDWSLIFSMIAIVIAVLVFPLLPLTPPELQENRVLSERPTLPTSIKEWASLPSTLDSYVADHFPLRPYLISALNMARYELGYSGSKRVIVGKDGWLFYDTDDHLGITAGKVRMDAANLAIWLQGFEQRVSYLKGRGIPFYMIMGPVKEDILAQYRPGWMPEGRVTTEIDDFLRVTRAAGYTQLVDPRPEMLASGDIEQLYSRYDTHWTGLGGYIGYKTLMARVAEDFPDMAPLPITAFKAVNIPPEQQPRNMALMLGLNRLPSIVTYATVPEHEADKTTFLSERHDWTAPAILHTESKSGKTLLLIRDSFSHEMLPFLKAHFSNIIVVHAQDGFFRADLVERYKPDAVILEIISTGARFVMNPLPDLQP